MKLSDVDTLFLSHILFYIKNSSPQFKWENDESIDALMEKCDSYLISRVKDSSTSYHSFDEECSSCEMLNNEFYEDEDAIVSTSQDDNVIVDDKNIFDKDLDPREVKFDDLLRLESISALYSGHRGNKSKLLFEKGAIPNCIDLAFGDHIIWDVTELKIIDRTLHVNCADGWLSLVVQTFPKDWTALLNPNNLYRIVQ